ncbi:MAG: response regulator transcription factor [Burkholderiales bacterium]|nr:response regulator transcription factor [Burkholderiales bacterium]MDR4516832.1 DNA-binding response regulator [Nitrosomonas sp.]
MRPITVAVAENDQEKCSQLEHYLRKNDQTIEVLTDKDSFYNKNVERRLKSRDNQSLQANTVARIKRLRPRVLFVNTQQLTKESFDLLHELSQHCPDTLPVVLIKEEADDNHILQALESGACGVVDCSVIPFNVSKIIETVDKGEPWVSRKMLVKIMDKIKFT